MFPTSASNTLRQPRTACTHKYLTMKSFAILTSLMLAHAASLAAQANHPAPAAGDGKPAYIETLDYKGFTGVHNSGNVDVIYTAGKEYSVTVEERGTARSTVRLEEGTITVSSPASGDDAEGKCVTTLRITAPALETLENYGNMQLTCGGNQPGTLEIENYGNMQLTCGGNQLGILAIENYGNMSFAVDSLSADRVLLENSGNIKADVSKLHVRGFVVENNGMLDGRITAEARTLDFENNGTSTLEADYKGGKATVRNCGDSKLSLRVDCETLNANNSGLSEMTFSGTADNVRIDGAGRSKVNVSQLNNF